MTAIVIISWYLVGFLAARAMIRAGHSTVLWCTVAAMLGGLAAPVALLARWAADRADLGPDPLASTDLTGSKPTLLAITDDVARADDLAWGLAEFGRPNRDALGVSPVGVEAFAGWLDTGERQASARALAQFSGSMAARAGAGGQRPHTVVTVGSVESVARRCRHLGLACVALPREAMRSAFGIHRLGTISAIADATGAAVLVVPRRRATATTITVAHPTTPGSRSTS